MPVTSNSARVCEKCGSPIETTSAGDLGCIACLIGTGLDAEAEQSNTAFASTPDQLGAYTIEHHADGSAWELGRGAMGVTYRAIDKALDRPVALKIINTDRGSHSAEARERFMREARAAAALRHPNVATVYQFGVRDETGQFFYAMELVEGETLEERVRRLGPLDVLTTIDLALQVTAALEAAEERGLVHRDLKPGNLMLVSPNDEREDASTQRGGYSGNVEELKVGRALRARREQTAQRAVPTVKVIDFGVAKAVADKTNPMALTHDGFVGTPAFASPEQFANAPVDVRSDIYSLGVTLWFLLTGHMLFSGRTVEEIQEARQSKPLPIEQLKAARVPHRFISLLTSMLAIEPAARPAGARELAWKLHAIRASITGRGKTPVRVALAAVIVVLATIVAVREFHSTKATPSAIPEKSIAVLPFENLSNDRDDAFFADGVQDDLLTKLAYIADLKVISRTSVMQYHGERNMREIGDALRVSHVLEGTVRKTGAWIHINAQLIDTGTDSHVWAKQYDGDLKNLFVIQSEIAKTVAEQLHAKVSYAEKLAIDRPPTADLTAFDLYTRGKNLFLSLHPDHRATLLAAVDLLNQAIAHDPSFFQAYCQLAQAHDQLYNFGIDHTPERLALADAAVQAAFRLRPDSGEAHLARAENLYYGHRDYDGALREIEIAQKTLPGDSRISQLKGFIQRRQGRWKESTRNLERAVDLDPRNVFALTQLKNSYSILRRYAEESLLSDRILALEPNDVGMKLSQAAVEIEWKADTKRLHDLIDSIRATDPMSLPTVAKSWLLCALYEHDGAAARNALAAYSGESPFHDEALQFSRSFVEGLIARITKDEEKARSAFTAARAEQEKIIRAQPNYGPPLCVLGLIDAALGWREEALREGRRAVELLPVEKDAINGPLLITYLAAIAAWTGDNNLACEQLATAIRYGVSHSYGSLKLHPIWDPLRGDPCFEKIVEEAKQPVALK
jgi:serine/threonine-protein kinase